MDAEKLARSKFKFEPDETRLPESVSIEEGKKAEQEFGINKPKEKEVTNITAKVNKNKDLDSLIDEHNKNKERLALIDHEGDSAIPYPEFKQLQSRNKEIESILDSLNVKSAVEAEPEAEIIPFRKKNLEPEEKADGGSIGLDYLMGMDNNTLGSGIVDAIEKDYDKSITKKVLDWNVDKTEELFNYLNKIGEPKGNDALASIKFQKKLDNDKNFFQNHYDIQKPVEGLDYLMGMDNRQNYASGGDVKKVLDIIAQVNKELKGKKAMEVMNPKTGEIIAPTNPVKLAQEPRTLGGLPIDDRSADIGDRLEKFSSIPITTLERRKQYLELRSEFIDSLDPRRKNKALDFQRKSIDTENRLILKAEEKGLDFDTFEKLRKNLYDTRKQKTLDFMRTGKVDLEPMKPATTFEEVQDRHRTAAKAADEIFPNYDDPKTAASSLAEVMAEQKYKKDFDGLSGDQQHDLYSEAYNYITSVNKLPKVSPANVPTEVLQHKMNEVLNSYDKSMFIKNDQGMVDVANPENIAKMEELLRNDHPELYNQLKKLTDDVSQKETLLDFDVTGREPNKDGGLNHLLGF